MITLTKIKDGMAENHLFSAKIQAIKEEKNDTTGEISYTIYVAGNFILPTVGNLCHKAKDLPEGHYNYKFKVRQADVETTGLNLVKEEDTCNIQYATAPAIYADDNNKARNYNGTKLIKISKNFPLEILPVTYKQILESAAKKNGGTKE